ncbi:alpha/beta hydrolase [Stenotrophomonas sp. ESTM1D_MKCIP4_1]|uniref:alpha/beta fold hydrolase n=1 Tax=Stenotrophomonas sp. ESTM1D_MKCIP4_1 TaxID=2072414 RepID=UPI000D53E385|nr:alpha/beta hydrolase [Stenotrophomonas sp. ESTM1D_MKCIP4_1]AWH55568.1 alpha/beta hydrolase [Stenotrophomonas sp. ESTM1D_MKCIP4_1]
MKRVKLPLCWVGMALCASLWASGAFAAEDRHYTNADLLKELPGFEDRSAKVDGIQLHYVEGGKGDLVVLLPGWPETWWEWHKMMPELAERHRVVSVDLRGMGESSRPEGGYDKKTMAKDIAGLVRHLGYKKASVIGHDIGSMVAFAFAANYPELTDKVVMMDVAHPDASLAKWPLLPPAGTFGDRIDDDHPYPWWFAFHQVKGLPEKLLEGRINIEQEWFFHYLVKNDAAIDSRDRAVYADAYMTADAIRAGDAWYQAFPQDILDGESYAPVAAPILALGGPGYGWLKDTLGRHATNAEVVKVEGSGHFIPEEKPAEALARIAAFLY